METNFAVYIGLLVAAAWCAAYMMHLRATAQELHERLIPALPYGVRISILPRLCIAYGMPAHAFSLVLLAFALHTLPREEAVLAYLIDYGAAIPLAHRFLTPPTGAMHYVGVIRGALVRRLRTAQARDAFRAHLLNVALERIP